MIGDLTYLLAAVGIFTLVLAVGAWLWDLLGGPEQADSRRRNR